MAYVKIVDLEEVNNFVVQTFFISICLGSQNYV